MNTTSVRNGQEGISANVLVGSEDSPASLEGSDSLKSTDMCVYTGVGGALRLSRLDVDITLEDTDTSAVSEETLPAGVLVMGAACEVYDKTSGCATATMDVGVTTADEDGFADGVAVTNEARYRAMVDGNSGYGIPVINTTEYTIKVTAGGATAPGAGESFKVHVAVWFFEEIPLFETENF